MKVTDVFEILILAITSVFDFAADIFTSINFSQFLIGAFAIFTIYRLLIAPLSGGGAGSDSAKSKKNKGDENTDG